MDIVDAECYRYRHFKTGEEDIRLLEIEDAHSHCDETVVARLRHCKVDQLDDVYIRGARKKAYEALSYSWGPTFTDGSHLSDITLCDGQPLKVTATLNQCLKRYRATRHGRRACKLLWVDAICINQNNMSEKNAHVQDMDRTYHNARTTVIWLGELTAADSKATMQNTLCRLLTGAGAPYGEWPVWRDVLDRSWFRRRWVLQEYALSCDKVFMIGDLMMPASDFMACIWKVGLRDEYEDLTKVSELPAAGRVIETPIEAAMEKSLLSRLHQFSSAENSHPLDCVYALHSISADRYEVTVDYRKSVRELDEEVAALYLSEWTTALPLLVSALLWSNPAYPSWLPDCERSKTVMRRGTRRRDDLIPKRAASPPPEPTPIRKPMRENSYHLQDLLLRYEEVSRDHPHAEDRDYVYNQKKFFWRAPEIQGDRLSLSAFLYREVTVGRPAHVQPGTWFENRYEVVGVEEGHALAGVHIEDWGHCRVASRVSQSEALTLGTPLFVRILCLFRLSSHALVLSGPRDGPYGRTYRLIDVVHIPKLRVIWWRNFLRTQNEITVLLE